MHHDTFNADFYVTAATVIPVLFLALTLQGTFYREILGTWKHKAEHIPLGPTTPDVLEALCRLIIPLLLASLIILFGFAGEIGALVTIGRRQSVPGQDLLTYLSIAGLFSMVLVLPIVQLWETSKSVYKTLAKRREELNRQAWEEAQAGYSEDAQTSGESPKRPQTGNNS